MKAPPPRPPQGGEPIALPGKADRPQTSGLQFRLSGNLLQNGQHRLPQLRHILLGMTVRRQARAGILRRAGPCLKMLIKQHRFNARGADIDSEIKIHA